MNKLLCLPLMWTLINNALGYRITPKMMADVIARVSVVHNTRCVEVLIHKNLSVDESSNYRELLNLLLHDQITKIFKMESYEKDKSAESDLASTKCFRPIRLTFGNERSKVPFEEVSRWPGTATLKPVSVVFLNMSIYEFFENVSLPYNLIVIGVEMVKEDFLEVNEVYRVDADFPMRIDTVGNWTSKTGMYLNPKTVFSRRYDFEGKILRAGAIEKWPISSFNSYFGNDKSWDGFYCRVWSELEQLLNFKSIHYKGEFIGIADNYGNWSGLINQVVNGEIDVIVGDVKITQTRLTVLDFTYPLISSWYQIYYKQLGYRIQWSAVFEPFEFEVWMSILAWIVVGSLSYYLSFHVCKSQGLEKKVDFGLVDSFFFLLRTLSYRDYSTVPNTVVCRTIFLMAYVAAAILLPAYSASLISFLTQHHPIRPFDSLDGLLRDGSYKLLLEANTEKYAYFKKATDKTLQEIYQTLALSIPSLHYMNFSSYGLEKVCSERKLALFEVQQIIKMKDMTSLNCELLSLSQSLTKVDKGIVFSKGSPYATYIHHHVHRMTEGGLIRRIKAKVSPLVHKDFPHWNPVRMEELFHIFSFLVTGILVSVAIFLVEIGRANFWVRKDVRTGSRRKVCQNRNLFNP